MRESKGLSDVLLKSFCDKAGVFFLLLLFMPLLILSQFLKMPVIFERIMITSFSFENNNPGRLPWQIVELLKIWMKVTLGYVTISTNILFFVEVVLDFM